MFTPLKLYLRLSRGASTETHYLSKMPQTKNKSKSKRSQAYNKIKKARSKNINKQAKKILSSIKTMLDADVESLSDEQEAADATISTNTSGGRT